VDGLGPSGIEDPCEEGRSYPPYHPRMMVKALLYAYAMGLFSVRRIARGLMDSVALRLPTTAMVVAAVCSLVFAADAVQVRRTENQVPAFAAAAMLSRVAARPKERGTVTPRREACTMIGGNNFWAMDAPLLLVSQTSARKGRPP
jgi:hypothetical protein